MSEQTKACNLSADEVKAVIQFHAFKLANMELASHDISVERVNYLNKRLNAFNEPDKVEEVKSTSTPTPTGWSLPNG